MGAVKTTLKAQSLSYDFLNDECSDIIPGETSLQFSSQMLKNRGRLTKYGSQYQLQNHYL